MSSAIKIDMRLVQKKMLQDWWISIVGAVLIALLMAVLTAFVETEYKSHSMVKLAEIDKSGPFDKQLIKKNSQDPGRQGMIVQGVATELSYKGNVKLYPRKTGTVLIEGIAHTPEEAQSLVEEATAMLVKGSNEAAQKYIDIKQEFLDRYDQQVSQYDQEITGLYKGLEKNGGVKSLLDLRLVMALMNDREPLIVHSLGQRILLSRALSPAYVVTEPMAPKSPYRPNWARNILIGVLLGLMMGVFTSFLLAVHKQIALEVEKDSSV